MKQGGDGLESKVQKFKPLRDKRGKYLPYCVFNHHRGIVLDIEVCEARECWNYRRLYLDEAEKPYAETSFSETSDA